MVQVMKLMVLKTAIIAITSVPMGYLFLRISIAPSNTEKRGVWLTEILGKSEKGAPEMRALGGWVKGRSAVRATRQFTVSVSVVLAEMLEAVVSVPATVTV